jgi:outer membrane protein OmpA-like peptidoglycan-associated protein
MNTYRTSTLVACAVGLAVGLAGTAAFAGDRPGVLAALDRISGNWPEAALEASAAGVSQGSVTEGAELSFTYKSAQPGSAALIDVNSHGEMTLLPAGTNGASGKIGPFQVADPLGTETVYVVFSNGPVTSLFDNGPKDTAVGDSRAAADKLAARINALASRQKVAVARIQYAVVAKAGGTEYTTRGIIRKIVDADDQPASKSVDARSLPAHIEFALNSADLTPQGKRDLDVFGEALLDKELTTRAVELKGFTDNTGDEQYNCNLSLRRAQSAQRYLEKSFGVDAKRLAVAGFGESNPIASNSTEATRNANRRVEFAFGKPGETSRSIATPCGKN